MSDEERDNELSTMEEASQGQYKAEWREDGMSEMDGKGRFYIDGEDQGREVIPNRLIQKTDEQKAGEADTLRLENSELRQRYDAAEPFLRLADKPVLREILNEYISRGEVEQPTGPAHSVEDSAGYRLRVAEPEAEAIMDTMRLHVSTLPEYEAQIIQNNPRAFNDLYDRVKATLGERAASIKPRPSNTTFQMADGRSVPVSDRASLEQSIRSKEVQKVLARVEGPGAALQDPQPEDPKRAYREARARLHRVRESGTPAQATQAEMDMIAAYFGDDDKPAKPKRGVNW